MTFDYGMKHENPVDKVGFYTKDEPDKPFTVHKDKVSWMLPKVFIEKVIRVYCKDPKKKGASYFNNIIKVLLDFIKFYRLFGSMVQ